MMNYFGTICLFALLISLIKANDITYNDKPLECYVGIYDGIYNTDTNSIPDLDMISNWTEKRTCASHSVYCIQIIIGMYLVQLLIS
jgi:heme A synthase